MDSIFSFKHPVTKSICKLNVDMSAMEIRAFNKRLDESSPTYKENLYIFTIASIENCTATDLVKTFGVSKAIVSQTLSAMEEKGFITRVKDSADSRKHIIEISNEKVDLFSNEICLIDQAIDLTLSKYSKEELDTVSKILTDISNNLAEVDTTIKAKNRFQ